MKKSHSMSKEHKKYLNTLIYRSIIVKTIQFGILALIFILWETAARKGWIDSFLTSSPSRMWKTLAMLYRSGELFFHIKTTVIETVAGFFLAGAIGFIAAVILWSSEIAKRVFDPYLVTLNALPKIALGPIIIIWAGAGMGAIITMAVLISVIIMVINMLTGFLSTDTEKILLLKSMGANRFQIFFKLVMPCNIPTLLSTLKINLGMAWVGTIMGEYLVSRAGLGYLIVYGGQVFQLDLVMTNTLLLLVVAGIMYYVLALAEKLILRHRG